MINITLKDGAQRPFKKHYNDACYDLTAHTCTVHNNYIEYGTGVSVEVPEGYCMLVFPRSSVSNVNMHLANSVGVIDANYRGEIKVRFYRNGQSYYDIGDRIAQCTIMPVPQLDFWVVNKLPSSDRGEGGFGSTGG